MSTGVAIGSLAGGALGMAFGIPPTLGAKAGGVIGGGVEGLIKQGKKPQLARRYRDYNHTPQANYTMPGESLPKGVSYNYYPEEKQSSLSRIMDFSAPLIMGASQFALNDVGGEGFFNPSLFGTGGVAEAAEGARDGIQTETGNVEAEGGELIISPELHQKIINSKPEEFNNIFSELIRSGNYIPADAPTHEEGGVDLNLPEGSYILNGEHLRRIMNASTPNDQLIAYGSITADLQRESFAEPEIAQDGTYINENKYDAMPRQYKKPNMISGALNSVKNFFTDDTYPLSWEQKIAIADGKQEMPRNITLNMLRHIGDEENMQIQLQNESIDPNTHEGFLHRIRKLPPEEQGRVKNMILQREQQRMGVTPLNTGEYDRPIYDQPKKKYGDGGIVNNPPEYHDFFLNTQSRNLINPFSNPALPNNAYRSQINLNDYNRNAKRDVMNSAMSDIIPNINPLTITKEQGLFGSNSPLFERLNLNTDTGLAGHRQRMRNTFGSTGPNLNDPQGALSDNIDPLSNTSLFGEDEEKKVVNTGTDSDYIQDAINATRQANRFGAASDAMKAAFVLPELFKKRQTTAPFTQPNIQAPTEVSQRDNILAGANLEQSRVNALAKDLSPQDRRSLLADSINARMQTQLAAGMHHADILNRNRTSAANAANQNELARAETEQINYAKTQAERGEAQAATTQNVATLMQQVDSAITRGGQSGMNIAGLEMLRDMLPNMDDEGKAMLMNMFFG